MRALEEDEFATEHQLVYRLDQVVMAMNSAAATHDVYNTIYT